MRTVITDRSLCSFTYVEKVDPSHIFSYISAARDAGVRYMELDFRTVMKMAELPDGVKYIFRVTDPVFADMADAFDFDYILLTLNDIKGKFDSPLPVICELPAGITVTPPLVRMINAQVGGKLSMIRLRGNFPLMSKDNMVRFVGGLRAVSTVPIDICPTNGKKTALDMALKLTAGGIDSLSMCIGATQNMVSMEEYVFTLMSVFNAIPKEFDISALCRAAVFHSTIFRGSQDSITNIMRLLDRDISGLMNVDTGERVKMHVSLRDSQFLHHVFVSTLEKMAKEENIPEDVMQDMANAIRHYNVDIFNGDLLTKTYNSGLLN